VSAGEFVIRLTAEEVREFHDRAQVEYREAGVRLRQITWVLPPLPTPIFDDEDAEYDHPIEGYHFEEVGYERTEDVEYREDHWHATTDGWDSMSESGTAEWVEAPDGLAYAMPDLDWD
jgi:hypothetical protein